MAGDAYFRLRCSKNYEQIETRIKEIYQKNSCVDNDFPFIDWDSLKWHSMFEDCLIVSEEYPDTLFTIEKQENDIDIFENPFIKYHFKNGKYKKQHSKIVWEKFNESEL